MRLSSALAVVLGLSLVGTAHAKKKQKADSDESEVTEDSSDDSDSEDSEDSEDSDDDSDDGEEEVNVNDRKAQTKKVKSSQTEDAFKRQDLTGHAVSDTTAANAFEKDRFFVDKVDTKKTSKTTLIQGSLASTSFIYKESGGAIDPMVKGLGNANSTFSRMFTELRLQTDFRHISGGRWSGRVDTRLRVVNTPAEDVSADGMNGGAITPNNPNPSVDPNHIQSGFNGTNEYDIRELWLIRQGKRSDVTIGRQYITDLGAVKIDGLRVDYAKSETFTLVGFGGLYPLRGSRSLSTDYRGLKKNDVVAGGTEYTDGGKFVSAGGFGGAYRTVSAHGAIGGVVIYPPPTSDEQPRVFATSSGYYRSAKQFDFYHFAIVDLVGSQGFQLTNLSAGLNYRPSERLRLNASFNRVDTDTLRVQANEFLDTPVKDGAANNQVQVDSQLLRLASNQARAGLAAGLGQLQRFEFVASAAYRFRPGLVLYAPDGTTQAGLAPAKGVEIFFSFLDRRSVAGLRLGFDLVNTRAIGDVAYQRSDISSGRIHASKEFQDGRGEWEAEASYTKVKDHALGTACMSPTGTTIFTQDTCFGASAGNTVQVGGNVFYRIKPDWFAMGSLYVNRIALDRIVGTMITQDPAVLGFTGFFRLAYRF